MYVVDYITLPGGLKLPIGLVTETIVSYDALDVTLDRESAQTVIETFSTDYLTDSMIAGQIMHRFQTIQWSETICLLQGHYACTEMIGKTRLEENIYDYGQTH
jgi:hypothetical protein